LEEIKTKRLEGDRKQNTIHQPIQGKRSSLPAEENKAAINAQGMSSDHVAVPAASANNNINSSVKRSLDNHDTEEGEKSNSENVGSRDINTSSVIDNNNTVEVGASSSAVENPPKRVKVEGTVTATVTSTATSAATSAVTATSAAIATSTATSTATANEDLAANITTTTTTNPLNLAVPNEPVAPPPPSSSPSRPTSHNSTNSKGDNGADIGSNGDTATATVGNSETSSSHREIIESSGDNDANTNAAATATTAQNPTPAQSSPVTTRSQTQSASTDKQQMGKEEARDTLKGGGEKGADADDSKPSARDALKGGAEGADADGSKPLAWDALKVGEEEGADADDSKPSARDALKGGAEGADADGSKPLAWDALKVGEEEGADADDSKPSARDALKGGEEEGADDSKPSVESNGRWRVHQMAEDYTNQVGSMMYPATRFNNYGNNPLQRQYPIEKMSLLGYIKSPLRRPTIIEKWSPYEIAVFEGGLFHFGKEFRKVSQQIGTKSTREVIDFYYIWKKTAHYKKWKEQFVSDEDLLDDFHIPVKKPKR